MSQLLQEHELRPVVQVLALEALVQSAKTLDRREALELAVQVQVLALAALVQSASILDRREVQPMGQGLVEQERSR